MASLTLHTSRRNSGSGRLERLRGSFSSDVAGKQYSEVYVTDCRKTIKIGGKIYPGAEQVFSFTEPDFADANSQLNLSGDLYVYVKAKGSSDDYSNAYKLPKDNSGFEDVGDIKDVKQKNIQQVREDLLDTDSKISDLNTLANLASDYLPTTLAQEINDHITNVMAELAQRREQLESDLREKIGAYKKLFNEPLPDRK